MDPASHSSTTTQSKFAVIRDRFVGEIISHSLDHLPRDTHSRFLVVGGFCEEKGGRAEGTHNTIVLLMSCITREEERQWQLWRIHGMGKNIRLMEPLEEQQKLGQWWILRGNH